MSRKEVRQMEKNLKVRILLCGKKSVDVIDALHKRGVNVNPSNFSRAINGRDQAPSAKNIVKLSDEIVSGWEKERETC